MSNARPWFRHYDSGVPHTLEPYPEHTLVDIVRRTATESRDHPAMFFKGRTISYGEVERESNALAESLIQLGVERGDRVALLMPNSPQLVIGELAVWKIGAVAVPLNPLYTKTELAYVLNQCGARTIIVMSMFYRKLKEIQSVTGLRLVIATSIGDYLPPLKKTLFTLLKEKKGGHRITLEHGDFLLHELIGRNAGTSEQRSMAGPHDSALFLFSGGTTGNPKCAVSTHRSILVSSMQIAAWIRVILDEGKDVVILNMPLFHVYGQVGIMTAAMAGRYPLAVVPNPRDLDDLLHTIKTLKPALLPGVPTLFTALLNHPSVRKQRDILQSIKLCVSGASPLLQETKRSFEELTGGRLIDAYSLTEATLAATFTPVLGVYKPGSVGIPVPDVEVRITHPESGLGEMATGEVGEVLMKAPQLMKEYWQNPEETAMVLRDGWLYTGDLGYLDEDGYLFIVDRKKDLIKPGGYQVWPRDVEEVIARHPAVQEVSVAGVPDPYKVEAVKAWIVLRDGARLSAEEICDFCRQDLASYKIPRHVEFIEALPKSTVGKVLRRKLVEEHCRKAGTTGK
ncbi:MAG: long-chain fatty acid--CoA ligase [Chlorobi bacterium]|nr:long-chain fatty acid--CoA ligase [Chlorobiota bacterium]